MKCHCTSAPTLCDGVKFSGTSDYLHLIHSTLDVFLYWCEACGTLWEKYREYGSIRFAGGSGFWLGLSDQRYAKVGHHKPTRDWGEMVGVGRATKWWQDQESERQGRRIQALEQAIRVYQQQGWEVTKKEYYYARLSRHKGFLGRAETIGIIVDRDERLVRLPSSVRF